MNRLPLLCTQLCTASHSRRLRPSIAATCWFLHSTKASPVPSSTSTLWREQAMKKWREVRTTPYPITNITSQATSPSEERFVYLWEVMRNLNSYLHYSVHIPSTTGLSPPVSHHLFPPTHLFPCPASTCLPCTGLPHSSV